MSGGYSRAEVIANIRKTRSLNELHDIATAPKSQVHTYAIKEAKAEIKRRLLHKRIKSKAENPLKSLGMPSMKELMRL